LYLSQGTNNQEAVLPTPKHDKITAKTALKHIFNAKQNRRRPFALGILGTFGVIAVARGAKPTAVALTLKHMAFDPEEAPATARKAKDTRVVAQGLLFIDEDKTLILQSKKTVPPNALRSVKLYFKHFKLGLPFKGVSARIIEDDEGDVDDGATDAEVEVNHVLEDAVEIGASSDDDPPPPYEASAGSEDLPPAYVASTDVQKDTATLVDYVFKMAPMFGMEGHDKEALGKQLEPMLQKVPMERLLLELISSRNAKELLGAETISPQPPIEYNDQGIITITDGVSAMLTSVARENGFLGEGEAIGSTVKIEKLVRDLWHSKGGAAAGAADVIREVTDMLWTFQATDGEKWVRRLLGVKGAKRDTGAIAALQNVLTGLRRDQASAFAAINRLGNALVDEFGDDDEQADALTKALDRLHNLAARVNDGGIATSLDAVLKTPVGEARIKAVLAQIDQMMNFAQTDELMKELDGNEVMPDMNVVGPVIKSLLGASSALNEQLKELALA
jgi:hypothetical protein